jgi:NAD(P)H-nitrite reductase large subunit
MASATAEAVCSDRVVCRCLQVTESELLDVMATEEVEDLKDVRRHTGAGSGCMVCHRLIKDYLARRGYGGPALAGCSE